jgi:hypothetical protein
MLRDNPVRLIEPMFSSAGANPLALSITKNHSSDDRPPCLENPRPKGAESTLAENAPSPFHAEPKQALIGLNSCSGAGGINDQERLFRRGVIGIHCWVPVGSQLQRLQYE